MSGKLAAEFCQHSLERLVQEESANALKQSVQFLGRYAMKPGFNAGITVYSSSFFRF